MEALYMEAMLRGWKKLESSRYRKMALWSTTKMGLQALFIKEHNAVCDAFKVPTYF